MTRLDRVLKLLEKYDGLAEAGVKSHPTSSLGQVMLEELRKEKQKLTQELIEHGYQRVKDIISQDIFSEKPTMQDETWCG